MTNPNDIKGLSNITYSPEFVLEVTEDYKTMTAKDTGKKHGLAASTVVRWSRRVNGPKQARKTIPDPPIAVTLAAWEESGYRAYKFALLLGIGRERGCAILGRAGIEYKINGQAIVRTRLGPGAVACSICECAIPLVPEDRYDIATPDGLDHETCRTIRTHKLAVLCDEF